MEHAIFFKTLDLSYLEVLEVLERECSPSPWSSSLIKEELESKSSSVIGMFLGSSLVGFLVYQVILDEVHILNIGVKNSCRRRGYGKLFIAWLIERMWQAQMSIITLEVREGNIAANKLYSSFGFFIAGRREDYYSNNGEAAVIMTLNLRATPDLMKNENWPRMPEK